MTLIQTIRSSPAKANDLFERIAATTAGAVKTRQGLFAQLKAELELHAALEQDHLLPALKKHPASKVLTPKLGERLRDMRTLLARIEKTPVDADGFLGDIAELKRLFQAHVRDEKSELLPAIRKVMSDEEAARVGERMEADRVAAEKADQDAADQRRADARRERDRLQAQAAAKQASMEKAAVEKAALEKAAAEKAAAEKAAAEKTAADKAEKVAAEQRRAEARREHDRVQAQGAAAQAAELAQREAERAAKTVAARASKAAQAQAELAARAVEEGLQASQEAALAAASQAASAVEQAARRAYPFAGAGQMITVMGKAGGEVSAAWSGYARKRLQTRVAAWSALAQCRTPADLISLQARLVRDEIGLLMDTSGRATEVASQAAADAAALFTR